MSGLALRVVIGLLLIIHGFAHWQITTGWGSRSDASSWLLGGLGEATLRSLGTALWAIALLVFLVAGVALLANQGWWRPLTIIATVISLATIALYWQPAMIIGALVDLGILIALAWAHWPSAELVGA